MVFDILITIMSLCLIGVMGGLLHTKAEKRGVSSPEGPTPSDWALKRRRI
jgi:hypothetical protein